MARLGFDASVVAKSLARFSQEKLERMQLVVDTESRRATLEVSGLQEAREFLKSLGLIAGKHYPASKAVEIAGEVLLMFEDERGDEAD